MSDLLVVLAMAAVTYGSRVVFLARPGRAPAGRQAVFLERFPLALFVSLAATTLLVPGGLSDPVPGYSALGGAVGGALLSRRSLPGTLVGGAAAYWLSRFLIG
ncbi:MAG TPA: AzlD domain-containing protein [Acidimicrobiia bacterium]|nr:AzlD domain-containing protein [Acidimicrobiia bacterium]